MGKISRRPTSMAMESTTLLREEKAAKLPKGPTASRPGPVLLMQARAAEQEVVREKPSRLTTKQVPPRTRKKQVKKTAQELLILPNRSRKQRQIKRNLRILIRLQRKTRLLIQTNLQSPRTVRHRMLIRVIQRPGTVKRNED